MVAGMYGVLFLVGHFTCSLTLVHHVSLGDLLNIRH